MDLKERDVHVRYGTVRYSMARYSMEKRIAYEKTRTKKDNDDRRMKKKRKERKRKERNGTEKCRAEMRRKFDVSRNDQGICSYRRYVGIWGHAVEGKDECRRLEMWSALYMK